MESPDSLVEYTYKDGFQVTKEIRKEFKDKGYIIVRGLLNKPEVKKLTSAIENSNATKCQTFTRDDGEGRKAVTLLWNKPANDITGSVTRCEKVTNTIESLLDSEIYPYHIKLSLKDAFSGGAWIWHQDYGYWYEDGCLFPDMASCFIALDKTTTENGCLKILVGSHKAGRINCTAQGQQVGTSPERLQLLMKHYPLLQAELDEGDAIIFHANIIHRSDQNNSPHRRWGFIISYNTAHNSPVYDCHGSAQYEKMTKVPDSAILESPDTLQVSDFYDNKKTVTAFSKIQQRDAQKEQ